MDWRAHKWMPVLSLAVACLLLLPVLLMRAERRFYQRQFPEYFRSWAHNGSFSMLNSFTLSEDNYTYAARIRQAGTHLWPGDPYIRENRSVRLRMTDGATFFALGLVHRLTGDIRTTWVLAQFLFVLLWVPALYAMMLRLGAAKGQALFVAVVVTLFADLARVIFFDRQILQAMKASAQYVFWFLGSYHYFFGPTRIASPLLTHLALFGASLAFVWAARREDRGSAAAAGLAGGLLAYVHWDVWMAFLCAALLYAAFTSWQTRSAGLRLWAVGLIAGAVSLPLVLSHHGFVEDAQNLGLVTGRACDWTSLPFLAGAGLALWRIGRDGMALWCACLLTAMFLANNAQVLTGWSVPTPHWSYLGNTILALVVGRALGGRRPIDSPAWLWLAGGACLLALPRAISYSAQHYQVYGMQAAQEEAFAWLDRNTPEDSVVAALSPQTGLRIPAYTHNKTAAAFSIPTISDLPPRENARRILYALSLFGTDLESYLKVAQEASADWSRRLWTGTMDLRSQERAGIFGWHFLLGPAQASALMRRAAQEAPLAYPVDYLWVGPFERSLIPASGLPGSAKLTQVFANSEIAIYKVP